jgi:diguanylate cyclase (GGDEF)-like protein/PAS domain S-box-containing protein
MSEWTSRLQEFVDGIAASVAVIARDEMGALIVTACNDDFFEMTGGRPDSARPFPVPFDTIVPSYARREFRISIMECFKSGTPQELEQAYDRKEGTHWWRLTLKRLHLHDRNEEIVDILVTAVDITQKMLLTHKLEVSTSRFRSVVDAAYDAIITMDQQHNVTLFNRAAEMLFGYTQEEILGQPLTRLLPERFRSHHDGYVNQFAQSPVNSRQMDERNRIYGVHKDGSLVPVEIAISKINVNGVLEFTAIIRDIADRIHLMDLLQKQATTDELTRLPNRRAFTDTAENMFRGDKPISLYILDIDHFKHVNDTWGHDIGDEVLKALAEVGRASSRKMDIFARLGGEEFVGLLPATELEQAKEVAEKLRYAIEHQLFEYRWKGGKAIPFTVSIGVATRHEGEHEVSTVLKRADEALYVAKETGRNRVIGEGDSEPVNQQGREPSFEI